MNINVNLAGRFPNTSSPRVRTSPYGANNVMDGIYIASCPPHPLRATRPDVRPVGPAVAGKNAVKARLVPEAGDAAADSILVEEW